MLKKMLVVGTAFLMLSIGASSASAAAIHNIQPGDSLYQIALNNNCTVDELKQANGLDGDLIYAGDKLDIPMGATASPGATNNKDIELLARLINAEASGEPFEGKVAVASVILNRMQDKNFPATIAGNIFKPREFEPVSNGAIWKQPNEDAYKAAEAACKGWDPTNGAKYFFNPAKVNGPSWVWTRTITDRIGNHVFGI